MGAARSKRSTLKDVAREAGVSIGLASRVLRGHGPYSAEAAQRVIEAATRLDYRPDMLARSLRLGRSRALGFVVSYLLSPHWTTFARDVDAAASRHAYQALVGTAATDIAAEQAYLRTLVEHRVAGIIAAPSPPSEPLVGEIVASGVPMVLLGTPNAELGAPRLNLADRLGARQATEHLLELGHRRIGMLAGPTEMWPARERLEGYRDALRAAGIALDVRYVGGGTHRFGDAYEAMGRLLDLPDRPTAVLAGNELAGAAALQCLKDRGVRLPAEMSVVIFGDPLWASFYRPAITAVRVPRAELARMAVETLVTLVAGRGGDEVPDVQVVHLELVVRESTARPI